LSQISRNSFPEQVSATAYESRMLVDTIQRIGSLRMHKGEAPALLSIHRDPDIRDHPFTCPQYVLIGSNSILSLIRLLITSRTRIPPLNNKFNSMERQEERVLNSKKYKCQGACYIYYHRAG
jgi:hypothetical protein